MVVPAVEGGGIAICPVPEAKTVKHRVHLDIYTSAISDLEALGATVLLPAEESGFGWTVMADPEGGEFCAFLRDGDALPVYRLHGVVVDSADPEPSPAGGATGSASRPSATTAARGGPSRE